MRPANERRLCKFSSFACFPKTYPRIGGVYGGKAGLMQAFAAFQQHNFHICMSVWREHKRKACVYVSDALQNDILSHFPTTVRPCVCRHPARTCLYMCAQHHACVHVRYSQLSGPSICTSSLVLRPMLFVLASPSLRQQRTSARRKTATAARQSHVLFKFHAPTLRGEKNPAQW